MTEASHIPTSEERMTFEVLNNAQQMMMETILAAVAEATAQVRGQLLAAGIDLNPAPEGYFDSVVHQQMYLKICGASAGTFVGGSIHKAIALIRNQQSIARHYWGADIELTPDVGHRVQTHRSE